MSSPADAFLFELLDLMQLAFPRPVRAARVVFAASDDGTGAVLTDLSGAPDESAPDRPDLGYPDEEVLDTINAVVGDIGRALSLQEGEAVLTGEVRFEPGDDGAVEARILDEAGAVRLLRRIDRSEQYELLHTGPLFAALGETEAAEQEGQRAVAELLGPRTRFALDVEGGRVRFFGVQDDAAEAQADVELKAWALASYHPPSRTFIWGWANESLPPALTVAVDEVRRGATGFGLRALHTPELLCPPRMAERLARHAAVRLSCLGAVALPAEGAEGPVSLFLAVHPIDDDG